MSELMKKNTRQLSMASLSHAYAYKSKLLKPSQVFKKNTEEKTQRYAIIVPVIDMPDYDEYGEPILDRDGNQTSSLSPVNSTAVIAKAQLSMKFDVVSNIIYGENEYSMNDDYGTVVDETPLEKYRNELKLILQAKMEKELQQQAIEDANADSIVKETNQCKIKASYSSAARYEYAKLLFPTAKDDEELTKLIKAKDDFPKKRSFLEDPYAVRVIPAVLVPLTTNNVIKNGTTKSTVHYIYLKVNQNLIRKIEEAIKQQPNLSVKQTTKSGVTEKKYICLVSQYNLPPDNKVTGLSVANFYENINPFSNIGIPGVGDAALIDDKSWNEIIDGLTYKSNEVIAKIPEYVADAKARYSGISIKTAIIRIKEFIASNMGIFDGLSDNVVENNKYLARLLVDNKDSDDFVRIANSTLIAKAEKLLESSPEASKVETPLTKDEIKHIDEVTSNPVDKYEDSSLIEFS